MAALIKLQVAGDILMVQLTITGKGEAEPVAPNALPDGSDDPAGSATNRRVEIVIPRR